MFEPCRARQSFQAVADGTFCLQSGIVVCYASQGRG
jgi:hypothetical protein